MKDNKSVMTVVVVVLAIIVIWILYSILGGSGTDSTPPAVTNNGGTSEAAGTTGTGYERTATGAVIVHYYTNQGFVPKDITISKGESVHFVNDSSLALNISPADTVNQPYATFDQTKSIGKGQSYDYNFATAGSYTYYDLNNKEHTGSVTVK